MKVGQECFFYILGLSLNKDTFLGSVLFTHIIYEEQEPKESFVIFELSYGRVMHDIIV
jgi:hypothetical protein